MKIQTAILPRRALNWAVARAEGQPEGDLNPGTQRMPLDYCTDWDHGGPLMQREGISPMPTQADLSYWQAEYTFGSKLSWYNGLGSASGKCTMRGETPLIAGMRCRVFQHFGPEVDVPVELLQEVPT